MTMKLSEAFDREFSAWVRWAHGDFEVHLKYLSVEGAERLVKDSREYTWDPKSHQKQETINEDRFRKAIGELVLGWRGATASKIGKLVRLKYDVSPEIEFDFCPENLAFALRQFEGFPSFILDTAKELHRTDEVRQEQEAKN